VVGEGWGMRGRLEGRQAAGHRGAAGAEPRSGPDGLGGAAGAALSGADGMRLSGASTPDRTKLDYPSATDRDRPPQPASRGCLRSRSRCACPCNLAHRGLRSLRRCVAVDEGQHPRWELAGWQRQGLGTPLPQRPSCRSRAKHWPPHVLSGLTAAPLCLSLMDLRAWAASPPPSQVTAELIEAAKKEGKVIWYTAVDLPVAERIAKAFEAKYPGIAMRVERSGGERIYQRIGQEYASNIHRRGTTG